MSVVRRIGRWLIPRLPVGNDLLYTASRRYVDRTDGQNDSNMERNGELTFLRGVLGNCRIVFDVGANVGEWAQHALAINSNISLHCFEPGHQNFLQLVANVPSQVVCNELGLSSHPDDKPLFMIDGNPGMTSLYQRRGLTDLGLQPPVEGERVTLVRFDDYCLEHQIDHVDFVKLDVEGHELEVLQGMTRSLDENRVGIIQFEYGGCNIDAGVLLKDLWSFFDTFSYGLYKLLPRGPRRVHEYSQSHENFQYQNWAAICLEYGRSPAPSSAPTKRHGPKFGRQEEEWW